MDENAGLIIEFLEESLESLTVVEEKIILLLDSVQLEADVNTIFRPVHSIKGAASFFKLDAMSNLAHKLETLLDQLRKNEREISPALVEELSKGFMLLRGMVERGMSGDMSPTPEEQAFTQHLVAMIEGGGDGSSIEIQLQQLLQQIQSGEVDDLVKIANMLQTMLPPPEVEEVEMGIFAELLDLTMVNHKQGDAPSGEAVKKKVAELKAQASAEEATASLGHLDSFLDEFSTLVDSGIGVDEMMLELLLERLNAAAAEYPKPKQEKEDSPAQVPAEKTGTAEPAGKEDHAKDATVQRSIRVNVTLLEEIMNLVGELVLARNQLNLRVEKVKEVDVQRSAQEVSGITSELQARVMKTRLQPVGNLFNPLPGMVRQISRTMNKEVELVIEGKDTELDRTILEGVKDPLNHILRNSLDHGLETPEERRKAGKTDGAKLTIRAFHEGSHVVIQVVDNGRGVNVERVKAKALEKGIYTQAQLDVMSENQVAEIIFAAGFSTAEKVSEVSGRGVGMDVVRSNVENLGGSIVMDSRSGHGTSIKMVIPSSLAIIPALMVEACGRLYAIPQSGIQELILLEGEEIGHVERLGGSEVYRLRGRILPLIRLNPILGEEDNGRLQGCSIVVLNAGGLTYGLLVDDLYDMEEIVVKALDAHLENAKIFSGATILGDGTVALIIDVARLSQHVGFSEKLSTDQVGPDVHSAVKAELGPVMLVFNVSGHNRAAVPMTIVHRLENIPSKKLERQAGRFIMQYRGGLLPLIDACEVLGLESRKQDGQELVVVVYVDREKEIGLVVDSIEDVIHLEGSLSRDLPQGDQYLGSAVLLGKITPILDLQALSDHYIFSGHPLGDRRQRVLLWDKSFERRQKRAKKLRSQGYSVAEATTRGEAKDAMIVQDVDVVVTDTIIDGETRAFWESLHEKGKVSMVRVQEDDDVEAAAVSEDESPYQTKLSSSELSEGLGQLLQARKS